MDVDEDILRDRQGVAGDGDQPGCDLVDAPQGGTQASVRVLFGDIWPQLSGDRRSRRPSGEAQMCNEALDRSWEVRGRTRTGSGQLQSEAVQQADTCDPRVVHRFPLGPVNVV